MTSVETNTNQHLRKKYFVDADAILRRNKSVEVPIKEQTCRIVSGSLVHMAKTARRVCVGVASGDNEKIDVHLVKNGARIEEIRIVCPCGRHTELDCRYEGDNTLTKGAERGGGTA